MIMERFTKGMLGNVVSFYVEGEVVEGVIVDYKCLEFIDEDDTVHFCGISYTVEDVEDKLYEIHESEIVNLD
jgi:hypothetical protein